jgi:hypothetical protein
MCAVCADPFVAAEQQEIVHCFVCRNQVHRVHSSQALPVSLIVLIGHLIAILSSRKLIAS